MTDLAELVDRVAETTRFSGVVRVDRGGESPLAKAFGFAHRAHRVQNTIDTQFAIASGSKGLTALTVVSLIESGLLEPSTTARSLLGSDLPLIAEDVTIEHLLAHRSGIGDYLDEEAGHEITDYVMPVPVYELATTEQFLRVLDGHATVSPAGERFVYNNGGYVVLALLAERAAGVPFHDLVTGRVCTPAGMVDTAFLRSDELPARAAVGYLFEDGDRSNVFHLPVRGSGDGGAYSTVADVHALWQALMAGRIVSPAWGDEMVRPRSEAPAQSMRYGFGFWLAERGDGVVLEGYDAGVSFRTVHDPTVGVTYTVMSNTSEGAWPLARMLRKRFGT